MQDEGKLQSGADHASLQALTQRVLDLEREIAASRRGVWARFGRGGKFWLVAGGLGALFGIGSFAQRALSQANCTKVLPDPLTTFCANTPASASQVNGNFKQVVDWTAAKVGT